MAIAFTYLLLLATLGRLAAAQDGYGGAGPVHVTGVAPPPTTTSLAKSSGTAATGGKPHAGGQSSGGSAAHGGMAGPTTADLTNMKYSINLVLILGAVVGSLLFYRIILHSVRYIR